MITRRTMQKVFWINSEYLPLGGDMFGRWIVGGNEQEGRRKVAKNEWHTVSVNEHPPIGYDFGHNFLPWRN